MSCECDVRHSGNSSDRVYSTRFVSKTKRQGDSLEMNNIKRFLSLTAVVVALGAILTSCESLWNDTGDGDTGTLTVLLTDAPFPADLVAEANVTIDSLSIREKGGGDGDPFLTLSTNQRTFDLLDLRNGVTEALAELDIPIGTYNLLRLYISDAGVVLKNGDPFPLDVPSGDESGLKLFIRPDLLVGTDERVEILLDIDVSKSFVVQGQPYSGEGITGFIFKPVVRVVNNTAAGSVKGQVTDANDAPVAGAQVSALLDTVISHTFTDATGAYALIGLLADTYTLSATAAGYDTVSVSGIEITTGKQTNQNFQLTAQ